MLCCQGARPLRHTELEPVWWFYHSRRRCGKRRDLLRSQIYIRKMPSPRRIYTWSVYHIHPEEILRRDGLLRDPQPCLSGNGCGVRTKNLLLRLFSFTHSRVSVVFQRCHDVVEREPYLRLCLSEVCGCSPQKACHCTVLTAYAQQCAQEGIAIQWRNQTFCRK